MSKTSRINGRVIVAGYDGSATAKAAVDYAARKAGPDGHVFVVHAYGPPHGWLGYPNYQRVLDDHLEHGRAVIDGLALEDDPLLETEWDADLIEGPAAEVIPTSHTLGTRTRSSWARVDAAGWPAPRWAACRTN